jgi:heme A synthase
VGLVVVAVLFLSPLRAAPGESPWPLALALASVFGAVALGGWLVLRKTPPPAE